MDYFLDNDLTEQNGLPEETEYKTEGQLEGTQKPDYIVPELYGHPQTHSDSAALNRIDNKQPTPQLPLIRHVGQPSPNPAQSAPVTA